jgi:excinuclease UvrABC nuclease subunit
MTSQELKKLKMPVVSGVYFFKSGKKILYIGKATSLRDRVRSYFSDDLIATRGPHIVDMVFKATTVEWTETDSVLEALVLEASLIKKHQPYYNTKEKDDKSWNYVCITDEVLPKVIIERGKNIDFTQSTASGVQMSALYGPFTSGVQLRTALKLIRRIFPFQDASSVKRDQYEFYRQLGLTPDVSESDVRTTYQRNIRHLKLFFEGKKKTLLASLKKEMMQSAKKKEFERAGELKRQIFSLTHINDVALMNVDSARQDLAEKSFRIEAYDVAHMGGKDMVGVMTVIENSEAKKNAYRKFIVRTQKGSNDTGALEEILSRRMRHTEWGMPDLIVTDGGVAQKRVAEQVLKRYQLPIPVVSVVKDDRHKARELLGERALIQKHQRAILLANVEAHRYSITFHKKKRAQSFLGK